MFLLDTNVVSEMRRPRPSPAVRMGARDLAGHPLSLPDTLIAATTAHHHAVLVTRHTKDFANLPLDLFDPWTNQLTLGEKHR